MDVCSLDIEKEQGCRDDDGKPKRTGTMWTAMAHIITAIVGSGVLSRAWAIGQLGWVAGPSTMVLFAVVVACTSSLLAECYRSGDSICGERNYTYMDVVRANLGAKKAKICGIIQCINPFRVAIQYSIAVPTSMRAIMRSNCFHEKGQENPCHMSMVPYMIAFGVVELFLSQIPNFDQTWWLSIVSAVMSIIYSCSGLTLGILQVVANGRIKGSLTGISIGTEAQKIWRSMEAFGDIAFAYSFSIILNEIQDTIKAPPPSEAKVMKKATRASIMLTTTFYVLCGCMGYAAFGNSVPHNLLTGFGFYNPFWLLDISNAAVAIHLIGAYQVYCQPLFALVEKRAFSSWKESKFIRIIWRSSFVLSTTAVAMVLPFFNELLAGLLVALGFWPLTIYFPIEIYIAQKRVRKWSARWVCLQMLSFAFLAISVAAAVGSIAGAVPEMKNFKLFKNRY